jgi:hypothetical protein
MAAGWTRLTNRALTQACAVQPPIRHAVMTAMGYIDGPPNSRLGKDWRYLRPRARTSQFSKGKPTARWTTCAGRQDRDPRKCQKVTPNWSGFCVRSWGWFCRRRLGRPRPRGILGQQGGRSSTMPSIWPGPADFPRVRHPRRHDDGFGAPRWWPSAGRPGATPGRLPEARRRG